MNPHISGDPYSGLDNYQHWTNFVSFSPFLTPRLIVSWGLNGHLSYPCDLNLLIQWFHISSLNTAYESDISKFIEDLVYAKRFTFLVYAKRFTFHFILYYPPCYYLYFTDDRIEPQRFNDLFKALTLNSMFFFLWPNGLDLELLSIIVLPRKQRASLKLMCSWTSKCGCQALCWTQLT